MADTVKDKAIQEWLKLAAREIAAFFGVTLPPMEGPAMEEDLNSKSLSEAKKLVDDGQVKVLTKDETRQQIAEMKSRINQARARLPERGPKPL